VIYRVSRKAWQLGGRWLINSRTFALPNIIAESIEQPHAMPELVPFFGDVDQLHRALEPLLTEGPDRQAQREVFTAIREIYDGKVFRTLAADTLLEQIGER
jgi:lipid A disaccharide synthetase